MHKILVIRLYFPLNAVHVSDCISPSSGATFMSCTSHLVYAGTCRYTPVYVGIATKQPHVVAFRNLAKVPKHNFR